ncbi:MAG: DUF6152 family protein [Gammaproteobacteria bacterium]
MLAPWTDEIKLQHLAPAGNVQTTWEPGIRVPSLVDEFRRRHVAAVYATLAWGFAIAPNAHAHHSWSTNYDASKTVAVTGVIWRMVFRNPHSSIMLRVTNDDGKIEQWTIEWGSPQGLRDHGLDQRTLKAGDTLWVRGDPHRNSSRRFIHMDSLIRLSDGLRISSRGRIESE